MSALAPAPNLDSYDRILVATSGGKDSVAALLAVLDAGADPSRIELHHHLVDGRGPAFMDWPSTEGWCRAVAAAFRLPLHLSWRDGGFLGEMLREDRPASPVRFEGPGGHTPGCVGGSTIQRGRTVATMADRGRPFAAALAQPELARRAMRPGWDEPVLAPPDLWTLPAGATGDATGPT